MCDYLIYDPVARHFKQMNPRECNYPNCFVTSKLPEQIKLKDRSQQCSPKVSNSSKSAPSKKSSKSTQHSRSSKSKSSSGSSMSCATGCKVCKKIEKKQDSSSEAPESSSVSRASSKCSKFDQKSQVSVQKNCPMICVKCVKPSDSSSRSDICEQNAQKIKKHSKNPCHQTTDPNRHLLDPKHMVTNPCEKAESVCLEERTPPGIQFISSSTTQMHDPCLPVCRFPCNKKMYVQPPRRKSCKPLVKYEPSQTPMNCDTIYKKSFNCIDREAAKNCRLPPAKAQSQLKIPKAAKIDCETTNLLSFQPNWCPEKVEPIIPFSPSLLGKGPLQCQTTQKHDFVEKYINKRDKLVPSGNLKIPKGNLTDDTVHKLSYAVPDYCNFIKSEPCRPENTYEKNEGPVACDTTYKLSFAPVCPPEKDDMPWARKAVYCPPAVPFTCDTVTKMSYLAPGYYIDECDNCCCEIDKFEVPYAPKAGL